MATSVQLGFAISSEEHPPRELVRQAVRAEEAGFAFIGISDHFHPWVKAQGHSPFVWAVLGSIAEATERIPIGTAVTCPTFRTHPGIVAHAAATVACLMPGRFFLGVGSGEALNEHVFAHRWPPAPVRLEMLEEAVQVIRTLWQGGSQDHYGKHYTVENATIFDIPDPLPSIVVAGGGSQAASLAAKVGDGLWGTAPDKDTLDLFDREGGAGRPRYGQVTMCWAEDEAQARKTAIEVWPNAGVSGQLSQDLPTPKHFEDATKMISEDDVTAKVVCGPDVARHVEHVKKYVDAGYTHVYIHQVGPDQDGFFRFWETELRPALAEQGVG